MTKVHETLTYGSLAELVDAGRRFEPEVTEATGGWPRDFIGTDCFEKAARLAEKGWRDQEAEALSVAERAVETVEREEETQTFAPQWDVAGAEVDVARFLSGEPENMVDYPLTPTTRVGRVVALCASVSVSFAISADTIKKRGHGIAALAFALSNLGYGVELWADFSVSGGIFGDCTATGEMKILIKGANDELDLARIMFAYAHPSMLRGLGFCASHNYSDQAQKALGIGGSYGCPKDPPETLDEGTIYLPCVLSSHDVPEAYDFLIQHMRNLGIVHSSV